MEKNIQDEKHIIAKRAAEKKYRETHPEKVKERHALWREANRERLNEYQRRYRKEHPEYVEREREKKREKYRAMSEAYREKLEILSAQEALQEASQPPMGA